CSFGRCRDASLGKQMNGTAEHDDGVGSAKVAPGMAPRTSHRDFEATAAESLGDDRVRSCAVEHYAGLDRALPLRIGKNMGHTTQIAFALLAHIADENKRSRVRKIEVLKCCCNGKHCGYTRRIVRNTRTVEFAPLLADVERSVGGKDRVQVGADRDHRSRIAALATEDVPDAVLVHLRQSERAKTFGKPLGTCAFSEGRRRNTGQVELPAREFRLLIAKPFKRRTDFGSCGQPRHFLRDCRSRLRGSAGSHRIASYYNQQQISWVALTGTEGQG